VENIFTGSGAASVGVTVGSSSTTTDASGDFDTGLPPSGVQAIALSGSGWVTRNTFASTNADLSNPLTLIPSSFDMPAYDDVAREAAGGETIRWMSAFTVYVDSRPEIGTGMAIPAHWLSATQSAAGSFPDQWTDGVFNPSVTVGTSPPADGTLNTIVIRFDNTINPSGCGGKVGQATFSWTSSGQLRWGVIQLALSRLCGADTNAIVQAVVGHELGHTMGLGHMTLAGRSSLMEPSVNLTSLSALDRDVATIHYHRAPNHASPDREESSWSGLNQLLVPVPGAARERTYVCGLAYAPAAGPAPSP
jgi:hypothetical protein